MAFNCTLNFNLNSILKKHDEFLNCFLIQVNLPLQPNQLLIVFTFIFFIALFFFIYFLKISFSFFFKQKKISEDEIDVSKLEDLDNLDSFNYLFSKFQHLEYPYKKLIFIRDIGTGEFGRVVQAKAPKLNKNNEFSNYKDTLDYKINLELNEIEDENDYQIVAVKMLKKNEQRKFLKRNLVKEAYLMAQFNHPNLIQLLGISITPQEHIYLLFEYMSKGDLNAFLRFRAPSNQLSSANFRKDSNFCLNELNLLKFAQQIADGMKYLSNLNLVHRDLATRNCLINDDLVIKIADFGLSQKLASEKTSLRKDVKTFKGGDILKLTKNSIKSDEEENLIKNERLPIRWMSPEALLFDHFSIKSDVWSFGILLWEIFTFAEQPYNEITENRKVIQFICDGNRLKKPDLSTKSLFKLMKDCWNHNPEKRPTFIIILSKLKIIEQKLFKKEKKKLKEEEKNKVVRNENDLTNV